MAGGVTALGELILIRHGETEWSRDRRHTGRTDLPLTERGEREAGALAPALRRLPLVEVRISPALRARRTAVLAGLAGAEAAGEATGGAASEATTGAAGEAGAAGAAAGEVIIDPDLWEWDYGGYEGRTTADIRQERPGWYLWRDGVMPGDAAHPGESVAQVGARADAVLARVRGALPAGDVALVAHGHLLRVLTARWLDLEPAAGRLFRLDTGTLATLGTEHGHPVITAWNLPPG